MKWNRKPMSQLTIEIVTQTQKSNEEPPVSIAPYADPGGEPVSKYGEEYHRIGGPTNQQNETSSKINPANASFDLLDDFSSKIPESQMAINMKPSIDSYPQNTSTTHSNPFDIYIRNN